VLALVYTQYSLWESRCRWWVFAQGETEYGVPRLPDRAADASGCTDPTDELKRHQVGRGLHKGGHVSWVTGQSHYLASLLPLKSVTNLDYRIHLQSQRILTPLESGGAWRQRQNPLWLPYKYKIRECTCVEFAFFFPGFLILLESLVTCDSIACDE